MPGEQQQQAVRDDLVLVDLAVPLGLDEHRQQVVPGLAPPVGHQHPQPLTVGDGHAEHLGDDGGGQRVGQVFDHVHLPGGRHSVEQLVGELADARAQAVHHRRGEVPLQQLLEPDVVGFVGEALRRLPETSRWSRSAATTSASRLASSYPRVCQKNEARNGA
ncbi:hypothetical protein OG943_44625 [Amycolatopsis sp. NBC_00345]